MKRPERALVLLKPRFLGDAVMACPLIDSVVAEYSSLVVMCGPLVRSLLDDRAGQFSFAEGAKISGIRPVLSAARQLRNLRVGHAYVVNRSFRSALAVRLAGIPARIGHATEGRGFLLTRAVPYDLAKFEADCYLDLARGMDLPIPVAKPRLIVTKAEMEEGSRLSEGATIGIQPGARYPEKQVPLAVIADVCRGLAAAGHRLVLLGGPDERHHAASLGSLLTSIEVVDHVGSLSMRQTMGLLAGLRLTIGSDTGLMHVAASVGTPSITVFGPNPASKWGHNYPPHQVLEAPGKSILKVRAADILQASALTLDVLQ